MPADLRISGFRTPSGPNDTEATASADAALPDAPPAPEDVTLKGLPLAILKDQIPIWTSPIRTRPHDLIWLLPLGAATGITLSTDTDTMREVSHDPTFNKDNVNVSNYLLGGELAIPAVMYGISLLNGNDHAHETGILSGEAVADAVVVEEVAKYAFRRERPLYNNAAGDFFVSRIWEARVAFRRRTARWLGQQQRSSPANIRPSGSMPASTQRQPQ